MLRHLKYMMLKHIYPHSLPPSSGHRIRLQPYSMHLSSGINATTFFQVHNGFQSTDPFPILKQRRASPKPKKVEGFSIYCHCHLPHKPEEPMIQFGLCKEWYHDICEIVQEECWNYKAMGSGFAVFVVNT